MNKDLMIGAIVITSNDEEGMIIDKVMTYTNSSNETQYLLMKRDRSVEVIEPGEISEVVELSGGNSTYFDKVEKFRL